MMDGVELTETILLKQIQNLLNFNGRNGIVIGLDTRNLEGQLNMIEKATLILEVTKVKQLRMIDHLTNQLKMLL
jgi:hypothetical protein